MMVEAAMHKPRWFNFAVYMVGLVLGFVLMGFEMLGSRYLNPYFGSGIITWAALISTVLLALMVGYFLGGSLVDRWPRPGLLGVLMLGAALYLFAVPAMADGVINSVLDMAGDGESGIILASIALMVVPLTLLGTFSPFGVRLMLESTEKGGRVTGWVYSVSTVGNVIGTLGTTFWLIPTLGTRDITTLFAALVLATALFLFFLDRRVRRV